MEPSSRGQLGARSLARVAVVVLGLALATPAVALAPPDPERLRMFALLHDTAVRAFFLAVGVTPTQADYSFRAPEAPGCESLRDATTWAVSRATIVGAKWTGDQNLDEVNETVWQFGTTKQAREFQKKITAAKVQECSRASARAADTADHTSTFGSFGTLAGSDLAPLRVPTAVFADSATQLTTTGGGDSATADFVTVWMRNDDLVVRFATRVASADVVAADGTIEPAFTEPLATITTAAASGLSTAHDAELVHDGGVQAVAAYSKQTLAPVAGFQPSGPPGSGECASLAKLFASVDAPARTGVRYAASGSALTMVSTQFDDDGGASAYFKGLRSADVSACLDQSLTATARPGTEVSATTRQLQFSDLPEDVRRYYSKQQFQKNVIILRSDVTITAGGATSTGVVAQLAARDGDKVRDASVQVQEPPPTVPPSQPQVDKSEFLDLLLVWFAGVLDREVVERQKTTATGVPQSPNK